MLNIKIHQDAEGLWPDLRAKKAQGKLHHYAQGGEIEFAPLRNGTQSGRSVMCIRIDLPDGQTVLTEMTYRNFLQMFSFYAALLPEETKQVLTKDIFTMLVNPEAKTVSLNMNPLEDRWTGEEPK